VAFPPDKKTVERVAYLAFSQIQALIKEKNFNSAKRTYAVAKINISTVLELVNSANTVRNITFAAEITISRVVTFVISLQMITGASSRTAVSESSMMRASRVINGPESMKT
jgi:hypothetical protein